MQRLRTSLYAAAGILILAFVLNLAGPKRVMAALGYTPVRDVDQPARHPFTFTHTQFTTDPGAEIDFTVPDKKRLVIEFVSFEFAAPVGQKPQTIRAVVSDAPFFLPAAFQATANFGSPFDVYVASSPTRLYADPGSQVRLAADRTFGSAGTMIFQASVSGYLVDLP